VSRSADRSVPITASRYSKPTRLRTRHPIRPLSALTAPTTGVIMLPADTEPTTETVLAAVPEQATTKTIGR
jgi:hypothetical protein